MTTTAVPTPSPHVPPTEHVSAPVAHRDDPIATERAQVPAAGTSAHEHTMLLVVPAEGVPAPAPARTMPTKLLPIRLPWFEP